LIKEAAKTEPPSRIVITESYGGSVGGTLINLFYLKKLKVPLVLTGKCYSACTYFLNADLVCYTQDTVFGFHGASHKDTPDVPDKGVNSQTILLYPIKLQEFLVQTKALETTKVLWILNAKGTAELDTSNRICPN